MIDFDVERSRATSPLFYHAPHPPNMVPMDFQLAGVEYAVNRDNVLIGDQQGLGKTAETIMIGNARRAKRTLVVSPASLRLNWEREVWKWSTTPNVSTYPILKSADGVNSNSNYVITSYALLANPSIFNALMDIRWDHLILDEAHAMKDPQGNTRTKAISGWYDGKDFIEGLESVCNNITMASGTILPNQPVEVYNACRLLNWEAIDCMSLNDFKETYYELGQGYVRGPYTTTDKRTGWQVQRHGLHWSNKVRNTPTNLADLQFRLRKHIMVRRLTDQVLPQIPPVRRHPFPLEMTAGIRKAMKHPGWSQAEKLYEMNPHAFDGSIPIDGAVSTARRELGEAKAPLIVAYIEDLIKEGVQKIVLAAWHHTVLAYLREKLEHHGLVFMDGSTSPRKKQQAVDDFQDKPEIKIILGQAMPLGEGWTLTAAQDVVDAEPDWVPVKNDQLVYRIRRIGQEGTKLLGHIPMIPNSLDERILNTAITKDQNIYQALDAPLED